MQNALLNCIEEFYDCITDETYDHQRAITLLSKTTEDTGFVLSQFWPLLGGKPPIAFHNLPDETIKALKDYNDADEVKEHAMFKNILAMPERMPMLRRAFLSDEEHFRTHLFKVAAEPWGIHSEGVVVHKKQEDNSLACWFARLGGQDEIDSELLMKISLLNNHLGRSMQLQTRIGNLNKAVIMSNSTLDLVDFGLVLFENSHTPVFINQPAQEIFNEKDGIEFDVGGLSIRNNSANSEFTSLISRMMNTQIPLCERTGGLVKVPKPSGKTPYNIMAIPLSNSMDSVFPNVSIAVLVFDPELKKTNASDLYISAFGLTQAEAALATELAQGKNLAECAEDKGISMSTVRTQLRSIFAKTETSRQAELISLLLRSITGVNLA